MEPGESPADCARRECREELGVEVELGPLYEQTTYAYPEKQIAFTFYTGRICQGDPCMRVHTGLCWAGPEELNGFDFCPADQDLVRRLARELAQ